LVAAKGLSTVKPPPSFDDIFAVISSAAVGDSDRRVELPDDLLVDDPATKIAVALNVLLDDLAFRDNALKAQYETLRRTEEQLRQSQKMESIGRLAGGVAHDFNNLLSVILSYGELLLLQLQAEDPLRLEVVEIIKAGGRAANLTRQLLAFSRQQLVEPRIIDLNELIRGMDGMIRRLIGEDIAFETIPLEGLGLVKADVSHLEQVILNLVVNARDAMSEGGTLVIETGNVVLDEVYLRRHVDAVAGPHVMLAVSDTGAGMDEATQSRLFEPFFTTKEKGRGTGLGLSTVYGIVKQNGGNIWVYSEVGRGTTFKIFLPRAADTEVPSLPRPISVSSGKGTETILLVEDDEQVREVVLSILRREGYELLEACDAEAALLISEQWPGAIHLLLTDVVMPKMNGRELAKQLVAQRPDTLVLFMSGYTQNVIIHHNVLDAGLVLLQKPFTPHALLKKVQEALEGRKLAGSAD
jgi:signal transduction histidine kinase/ActR/RegA family two-component response regulator